MIKTVEMYTVVCDNCGKDVYDDSDCYCWNDKGFVEDDAMNYDWIKQDDKHYCADCYSYDDDDNLIIGGILNRENLTRVNR
jgi:ribosomal protein L37E